MSVEGAIALPEKRDVEIKLEPEFIGIKRHVVHALRDD